MSSGSEEEVRPLSQQRARPGSTPEPARVGRVRLRRSLLALIALLYVASIPWYRRAGTGDPPGVLFGLPDWVAVALVCYAAAAFLNAGAWLLSDVHDFLDSSLEEALEEDPGAQPPANREAAP
jgi:hypothetical protein